MSTFNCTCRHYGPTLYSRGLLESDVAAVQAILADWEDWALTDEEAELLTKSWAQKDSKWYAPYHEGMPGCESTTLFCLKSDDTPVFINRCYQYGTHVDHILQAVHPDYRLQGIYKEANQMLLTGAWDYYGMKSITMRERVDTGSLLGIEITNAKTGQIFEGHHKQLAPNYKSTTTTYEEWAAFKETDEYKSWAINYTMYPKYPGDPI